MHSKWSVNVPRVCSYIVEWHFSNLFFQKFLNMGPNLSFWEINFRGGQFSQLNIAMYDQL